MWGQNSKEHFGRRLLPIHQPFWRESRKDLAKITYDIFISYAKEDEAIVRSIYDDLTRSKLNIWDFKKKGEIGADFEQEFKQKVENSRYFCLIDSSHSRKAKYVQMECLHAIQIKEKKGFPKMIVCKVGGERKWREKEIFPRQNYITRIDFTDYEKGIKRLCKFLSVPYSPCFTLPRDKDFTEEMSQLSMYQSQISTEDWQNLMGNYERFRQQYNKNKKYAEALLTVIILQSEELGIQLKTPYLALGVLQAGSNRHKDALETFEKASQIFRDDPRFWAGLGGAQYYLTQYELAVESYCRCIELIKLSQNEIHESHLVEVVHNLEETLCALGEHYDAYNKITSQYKELLEYPETQTIIGKILIHLGKADQSRGYLENAYENYRCKHNLTLEEKKCFFSLILTLAECYKHLKIIEKEQQTLAYGINVFPKEPEVWRRYALFFWETNNTKNVIKKVTKYLEKAIGLSGGNVKYRVELALILYKIGEESKFRKQLEECFMLEKKRAITTAIDDYYLGLAYFLDNRPEIARKQYEFSKGDKKIANWPYYDQLTSKKY